MQHCPPPLLLPSSWAAKSARASPARTRRSRRPARRARRTTRARSARPAQAAPQVCVPRSSCAAYRPCRFEFPADGDAADWEDPSPDGVLGAPCHSCCVRAAAAASDARRAPAARAHAGQLFVACEGDDLAAVQRLLAAPGAQAHIDATGPERDTLLHIAALYGHEEVFAELLGKGANPLVKDDNNSTPLARRAHGMAAAPPPDAPRARFSLASTTHPRAATSASCSGCWRRGRSWWASWTTTRSRRWCGCCGRVPCATGTRRLTRRAAPRRAALRGAGRVPGRGGGAAGGRGGQEPGERGRPHAAAVLRRRRHRGAAAVARTDAAARAARACITHARRRKEWSKTFVGQSVAAGASAAFSGGSGWPKTYFSYSEKKRSWQGTRAPMRMQVRKAPDSLRCSE